MTHNNRGIGSRFLILYLVWRLIGTGMSCNNETESSEATAKFNFPEISVQPSTSRHTFNGIRLGVLGDVSNFYYFFYCFRTLIRSCLCVPQCRLQYDSECKIDNSSGINVFERGVAVSLLRDLQLMLNFTYS